MTGEEIINGLYELKNWKCNGDAKMYNIICGAIKVLEQKPCEDAVSRKEIQQKINRLWNSNGDKDYCMETLRDFVTELPPVKPTRKRGEWIDTTEISTNKRGQIVHEVICSECNGISYFRSMGNKYIGANLCPNCGAEMESED